MNNLLGTFVNVWLHPMAAMSQVKAEGENASLKPAMIFIVVMGLLSGLITAVVGMFVPPAGVPAEGSKALVWASVLVVPAVSFIGSFVGAFIVWGLVDGLLRGTLGQYKLSYRILALLAAFSPVSAILAPIPAAGQWLAILVNVWATIVLIRGLIVVRGTSVVRTWVTCGIIFGLLFALGIAARVAAQRQLGTPGLGELEGRFGGLDDDLQLEDDATDQQLEQRANDAKKAQ